MYIMKQEIKDVIEIENMTTEQKIEYITSLRVGLSYIKSEIGYMQTVHGVE